MNIQHDFFAKEKDGSDFSTALLVCMAASKLGIQYSLHQKDDYHWPSVETLEQERMIRRYAKSITKDSFNTWTAQNDGVVDSLLPR